MCIEGGKKGKDPVAAITYSKESGSRLVTICGALEEKGKKGEKRKRGALGRHLVSSLIVKGKEKWEAQRL